MNRERNEGKLEGRSECEVKKVIELTQKKLGRGVGVPMITEHLEESVDFVKQIVDILRKNPSVKLELILEKPHISNKE